MYKEKIVITGASGVIGQALYQELTSAGYQNVVALSSKDADFTNQAQTVELFETLKPRIVYHLAARVYGIMGNLENKGKAFVDNVRINTNVIDAAWQSGAKKIVAMGSAAIYSDSVTLPMTEEQIWKGPPHYSEAAYAHSKRAMMAQLEAYYQQYGLDYAFCVSTNLYGPHDKFDKQWGHVIPSLICKFHEAIEANEDVSVWGTGKAKRDFLFSEDAANALRLIAEQYTGPINLATGQTHTIAETVKLISEISGFKNEIKWDSTKPDGQNLRQYDIQKLEAIGFKSQFSLEQGLEKTYKWFENNAKTARK